MTFFAITASAILAALQPATANAQDSADQPIAIDSSFHVAACYPHDSNAFTQGLTYHQGYLYESTGRKGQSTVRKVAIETGGVEQSVAVPPRFFGEGSTIWKDQIISLSWQAGTGFRWRLDDLQPVRRFQYAGEGWGLTHDGTHLIMSDGTPIIRFRNPEDFSIRREISVTINGQPLRYLNELEWVDGSILANIWMTDVIARIDPATGVVTAIIDLSHIVRAVGAIGNDSVLNGIAWDADAKRLFVTGKNWPWMFELRQDKPEDGPGCPLLPPVRGSQ